jgi:ParB family chromosome partitioning protein
MQKLALLRQFSIAEIDLKDIDAESFIMRSDFGDISQLAESIRLLGLLEPLVVRQRPYLSHKYQLLAGHRRFRACVALGMGKAKACIVDVSDKDAFLIALCENVQRKSLNPLEESMAYSNYVHKRGWGGLTELAKNIGKSPAYVHTMIKLLELPREVQKMVESGEIGPFVAAELIGLRDEKKLLQLANSLRMKKTTMRQVRSIVKRQKFQFENPKMNYLKTIEEMIVSVRNCLINFDISIGKLEDNSEFFSRSVKFRYSLHQLLDQLINERAEVRDELRSYADFA